MIEKGEAAPSIKYKFSPLSIKSIRSKLKKSQREFTSIIGVSVSTLQNWEQGGRDPECSTRALLKIASENPDAVSKALGA